MFQSTFVPIYSVYSTNTGSGGKNLKNLTSKTCTKIEIPKTIETDPEAMQIVKITGLLEDVELAKKEIMDIVYLRRLKITSRVPVDRGLIAFLSSSVASIQDEFDVKIILPLYLSYNDNFVSEIAIVGDKDSVGKAVDRLNTLIAQTVYLFNLGCFY